MVTGGSDLALNPAAFSDALGTEADAPKTCLCPVMNAVEGPDSHGKCNYEELKSTA